MSLVAKTYRIRQQVIQMLLIMPMVSKISRPKRRKIRALQARRRKKLHLREVMMMKMLRLLSFSSQRSRPSNWPKAHWSLMVSLYQETSVIYHMSRLWPYWILSICRQRKEEMRVVKVAVLRKIRKRIRAGLKIKDMPVVVHEETSSSNQRQSSWKLIIFLTNTCTLPHRLCNNNSQRNNRIFTHISISNNSSKMRSSISNSLDTITRVA